MQAKVGSHEVPLAALFALLSLAFYFHERVGRSGNVTFKYGLYVPRQQCAYVQHGLQFTSPLSYE